LLAIGGALLAGSIHSVAAADPQQRVESINRYDELLTPQERAAIPRKGRVFAAASLTSTQTKHLGHFQDASGLSPHFATKVSFGLGASPNPAALLHHAHFWAWASRGPPRF
jgi:hypothetical protein